jgi:hypothetical protein
LVSAGFFFFFSFSFSFSFSVLSPLDRDRAGNNLRRESRGDSGPRSLRVDDCSRERMGGLRKKTNKHEEKKSKG